MSHHQQLELSSSSSRRMPLSLPPKSPASLLKPQIVLEQQHSQSRRRRRRKSKERRSNSSRDNKQQEHHKSSSTFASESLSSSSTTTTSSPLLFARSPQKQQKQKQQHLLADPCPHHLKNVGTDDPDELSVSPVEEDYHLEVDILPAVQQQQSQQVSPTSVAADGAYQQESSSSSSKDYNSFDSTTSSYSTPSSTSSSSNNHSSTPAYVTDTATSGVGTKSCLGGGKHLLFRRSRRQKVHCADVASVSNASDTSVVLVVGTTTATKITGRELHELAKSKVNQGEYAAAVQMFDAIYKAQVERFGAYHCSTGAALHNVGVVCLRMAGGDALERAEHVLLQAVAIRRHVLLQENEDHTNHYQLELDLALSLSKLGSARMLLKQFDDALVHLQEAQTLTRTAVGTRHHKLVAQIMCHIACLYFEVGELVSAQATFEDALDVYRECSRDHVLTEADRDACRVQLTEVLCNIGSIHNRRKHFVQAIACFQEALELQRRVLGPTHARVLFTLDNLGYSYSKHKDYGNALSCFQEMLQAQTTSASTGGGRCGRYYFTNDCCMTLKKQNIMYEKLKDLEGAIAATEAVLYGLDPNTNTDPGVYKQVQAILDKLMVKAKKRCSF